MAKPGIAKTNKLILREARRIQHHATILLTIGRHYYHHRLPAEESRNSIDEAKTKDQSCWIPHPRTGIYMPKGHERVMEDVPEGAALFDQTSWLRNVDGVDRHHPDVPTDYYLPKHYN
ncbi:uncharacterized protein LOC122724856 [Manihot esculenta]|uniref:Uncharacterized protein n=1 Tax=Manihot esculenta TaxID=3983 RepID=A0A2C9V5H6_MANES|nr:uncharacterized protein LOC122724856 [Manihot esculenta]OAY39198.1 hypothetical protein MANES_10G074900v8 [Manihot esculenta]